MTRFTALGTRSAIAVSLVIMVAVALLTANGIRLQDAHLVERENQRLVELRVFMNATLASHLARDQRDQIRAELAHMREDREILYLAVLDADQRLVLVDGWQTDQVLPARVEQVERIPRGVEPIHGYATLNHEGRLVGYVAFGLDSRPLREAHAELLWQSVAIGALAVVAGALAAFGMSALVTRDLRALRRGVAQVEGGNLRTRLSVKKRDEIGDLTMAFNRMTQTLDDRMRELVRSEARFHAIADFTYGVELWFSPRGWLLWANPSIERVTGYTPQECVLAGDLLELLVVAQDRRDAREKLLRALQDRSSESLELRLQRKDGSVIWATLNWQPIYAADGAYAGLRVSGEDISARKAAEIQLLDSVVELRREQSLKEYYLNRSEDERLRLAALLDVLRLGILFVGSDQRVVYCNRAYLRLWGFAEAESFEGMRAAVLLDRLDERLADAEAFRHHVDEVVRSHERSEPHETALADGRVLSDVSSVVPGDSPTRRLGRVWIYEDITERKSVAARLTQMAERDPLTNLYNRRRFHEEIARNLAESARRKSELGLLIFDLDGFKPINDEFGHQAGDTVLVAVAREVGAIVRRNEMFFRLGGDEFAVLASDATEFEIVGLARRIAECIAAMRFPQDGRVGRVTASIGIALYPQHAGGAEELVARADAAMYEAKAAGKNRWRVFHPAA